MEDITSSFGESSIKSGHTGAVEEEWIGKKSRKKAEQ